MTHPTLGYNNLRFDGDTLTHMPATPTATLCVACSAGNGPLSGDNPFPHDMDAAVDCPNCLRALESDWWMALMENERRTGETTSLTGTLDDVRTGMARLLSQVDAVTEETLLGGGASMFANDPTMHSAQIPGGIDWAHMPGMRVPPLLAWATQPPEVQEAFRQELIDVASPVTVDVTDSYLFAEDKVSFRARRGDAKAYEHVENPVTPEKLADAMKSLWTQLELAKPTPMQGIARGNADDMLAMARQLEATNDMMHRQVIADAMEKLNALPEDQPPPITSSVHAAIERAQQTLAEHPFGEAHSEYAEIPPTDPHNRRPPFVGPLPEPHDCDRDSCAGWTSDPPCGGCCHCLGGCVYDGPSEVDRDDKGDGEQGEGRSACGPDCEHGS